MIGKKGILRFFYKVTMVCYKKLHLWRIPIPGRDKVQADLNRMHPGENPQECVTDYYVTKLTLSAVILIAGIMLAITAVGKVMSCRINGCIGDLGKRAVGNTASPDRWRTARDILSRWK